MALVCSIKKLVIKTGIDKMHFLFKNSLFILKGVNLFNRLIDPFRTCLN